MRSWDASTYDRLPLPHEEWGRRTLARLRLAGHETVIEAGCGTGRDTEALLDALPRGRVIAIDGSPTMLTRLRQRLAGRLDRVHVVEADLRKPLPIDDAADAILSVATFHWIADHAALFQNLAAHLKRGGQLAAECGGHGQLAKINRAVSAVRGDFPPIWNFADVEETERRLGDAGFVKVTVELRPDPARFATRHAFREYLRTVVLGSHLDTLPESERPAFLEAVVDRLPDLTVDYVRLEMTARKG